MLNLLLPLSRPEGVKSFRLKNMWTSRVLWLAIAATLLPVSATGSSHLVLGGSSCFMPIPAIFQTEKSLGMDSGVCRRRRESTSLLGEMLAKSGGKKAAGNANRFVANLSPGDDRPSLVVFDLVSLSPDPRATGGRLLQRLKPRQDCAPPAARGDGTHISNNWASLKHMHTSLHRRTHLECDHQR
jgi:hypothetical protein